MRAPGYRNLRNPLRSPTHNRQKLREGPGIPARLPGNDARKWIGHAGYTRGAVSIGPESDGPLCGRVRAEVDATALA